MPRFRPDLDRIAVYEPGKPIDEVARELGLSDIVKLASNENPDPPFPEVQAAIADATGGLHRYPETSCYPVVGALADHFGVDESQLWVGAGSSQLLMCIALATGGPGASAVYAHPAFVMYRIITAIAGAEAIEVPLDEDRRHDLDAIVEAVRDDTRVVYLCNPNNPTGTHVGGAAVRAAIDAIDDDVLVVVDEAYAEYVTAPDYATAIPLAIERPNVVVSRTFSKIYGLAGLRIGYLVGHPDTLAAIRRPQPPFSVTTLAQVAAAEALRHPERVTERVEAATAGRAQIEAALAERGLDHTPSQTNFVLFTPPGDAAAFADAMLRLGVIVRKVGPWIRVTVGTPAENARFAGALDQLLSRP